MTRTFAIMSLIGICTFAQAAEWDYVNKENVNMRSGASQSASVVTKAHQGMVVEPLAKEGAWTKVRTLSGQEMYISSQFLTALPQNELKAEFCLISPQTREDALYELGYTMSETGRNSEATTRWILIGEDDNDNVKAEYTWQYADTSGRMQTVEKFYTGKKCGWYVELTGETDGEFLHPEKLDTPIYIYQPYSPTSGIYVNDEYFSGADEEWGD